ncbi:MAG: HD domain-containing protein [Rhodospirillaceae bacterium]|jgi:predicted HD phosphohydrolase|nr:HD domain-containing protein [Rhodospirillaceae bacterium]MBT6202399.1 HD domain-containing protein [Rhodospirillaceae bacterium]MBT6509967.1 HD domain-containing protein [Rhodospirillaceae bacterium]MBT7611775.1 HD domain-containing protein [Rhodospirillaceae bacterium]
MAVVAEKHKTAYDLIAEGAEIKPKATYRSFDESTAEDWAAIITHNQEVPDSSVLELCLDHLERLKSPQPASPVDRYEHSLQTTSRAWRDGHDGDGQYIAAALLHDIGDFFAPHNHGEFCASVLKPYVRPEIYWLVKHHELGQGYHFFHHLGADRNAREKVRAHPYAELCFDFCDKYDQTAFDPDYDTMPLDAFMPSLQRVFERPLRETEPQDD